MQEFFTIENETILRHQQLSFFWGIDPFKGKKVFVRQAGRSDIPFMHGVFVVFLKD